MKLIQAREGLRGEPTYQGESLSGRGQLVEYLLVSQSTRQYHHYSMEWPNSSGSARRCKLLWTLIWFWHTSTSSMYRLRWGIIRLNQNFLPAKMFPDGPLELRTPSSTMPAFAIFSHVIWWYSSLCHGMDRTSAWSWSWSDCRRVITVGEVLHPRQKHQNIYMSLPPRPQEIQPSQATTITTIDQNFKRITRDYHWIKLCYTLHQKN